MNIIIKTGFETISDKIQFQPKSVQKGKQLVEAKHVKNVEEHRQNAISLFIRAEVIRQTAVTSTSYNTKLYVSLKYKMVFSAHNNFIFLINN